MILGGGVTGLAAGLASGLPVYEREEAPGGICSSYYLRPGKNTKLHAAPRDGEAYRFELGGGHWIHGSNGAVLRFIRSLTPVGQYSRKSAVYFPDTGKMVPYPIQNNLTYFGPEIAQQALYEITSAAVNNEPIRTMADWLRVSFGETLCNIFFAPFHELYTVGLWKHIEPQDSWKSPVNLKLAVKGAFNHTDPVGYNKTFIYPVCGLDALVQGMAAQCDVRYGKTVVKIDAQRREVVFTDGEAVRYETLICTLPLNRVIEMTGLQIEDSPDPSLSVLVMNIGARKGRRCPDEHWVYIPQSNIGFHRVGFYSNVDVSFLPASARNAGDRTSIYVEKSYPEGHKPSSFEMTYVGHQIVEQLRQWDWIEDVEVIDPTWIDVGYTWSRPGSKWKGQTLRTLEECGIYQVGRYACWVCQGIADSIRDGLTVGAAFSGIQGRRRRATI